MFQRTCPVISDRIAAAAPSARCSSSLPTSGSNRAIDWGEIVLEPPFLTYTDAVTVWVDELRADVRFVGRPAHTTNDSIIWLPERKVLYCGDLLFHSEHRGFDIQAMLSKNVSSRTFSFYYPGRTEQLKKVYGEAVNVPELIDTVQHSSYIVLYYQLEADRNSPPNVMKALAGVQPEKSIWINGIEYARIYRVDALPQQFYADLAP